jgi:hypothetical protein
MVMRRDRGVPGASSPRRQAGGESGQILVLFTLCIVVIMGLAALVIDAGLLRTDGQRLWNALDASALAGAQGLPATQDNVSQVKATARDFALKNYPGLPEPTIELACLIGENSATGLPNVSDMPTVCNVSLAASDASWRCQGRTCWAPCDPATTSSDVCNTIMVSGSATRDYTFGRVLGINEGSTGTRTSAACTGECGTPQITPVDAVVVLDRTSSMDGSTSVGNLRGGARAVLAALNPAVQRVAFGFTGPSSLTRLTSDTSGQKADSQPTLSCAGPPVAPVIALSPGAQAMGAVPDFGAATTAANSSSGATTLVINRPSSTSAGHLLLAGISVAGGSNVTITPPSGWTLVRRTNNSTSVGVATYRKIATSSEPSSYTWSLSPSSRASGGITRLTGVDASTPVNVSAGATGSGTSVAAPSVTTTVENTLLVGFFGSNTNATFTAPDAMTERLDVANASSSGPAVEAASGAWTAIGATGTRTATASKTGAWAAQLVAVRPTPSGAADTYGSDVTNASHLASWIPIGMTGTDSDSPAVTHNEAYVDTSGNVTSGTHVAQAIGCFDVSSTGTNLARPIYMAIEYLENHGRDGSTKGIILETDGAPNQNGYGLASDFTNSGVLAAASAAKAAGIQLFTIGYGVDGSTVGLLAQMASSSVGTPSCTAEENQDGDHFFCQPAGGDLASVLRAATQKLATGAKLVQLYPQPVITSVSPANGPEAGGTTVMITGKYFTDAYSVTFGGTKASSFTVLNDSSIRAVAPAGSSGSTVDIRVSTAGGSTKAVPADRFTYGP